MLPRSVKLELVIVLAFRSALNTALIGADSETLWSLVAGSVLTIWKVTRETTVELLLVWLASKVVLWILAVLVMMLEKVRLELTWPVTVITPPAPGARVPTCQAYVLLPIVLTAGLLWNVGLITSV